MPTLSCDLIHDFPYKEVPDKKGLGNLGIRARIIRLAPITDYKFTPSQ